MKKTKDLNVRFGPSGNDELFYQQGFKATVQAMKWVSELGLNAFEVCFGRGSRMSTETAHKIGSEAEKYGVQVSVHAPYYINLAKPEMFDKNYRWIEQSLRMCKAMGGNRIVVHVASQGDFTREQAIINTEKSLREVLKRLEEDGYFDFLLCIETMGRYKQIGNYQEICQICKIDKRVVPTLDFGHINCVLQGELQTNPDKITEIIDYVEAEIGLDKLRKVHVHWSAIEYTEIGERKHTTLDNGRWNFSFKPFVRAILEKGMEPVIICESQDIMAQDAVKLKKEFESTQV